MNLFRKCRSYRDLLGHVAVVWLLGLGAANAEEILVNARVLRSEPIFLSVNTAVEEAADFRRVDPCEKPLHKNLLDLLNWDLGACPVQEELRHQIQGFRVYYEWDNQEFSFVSRNQPGTHIPLKVLFNSEAPD